MLKSLQCNGYCIVFSQLSRDVNYIYTELQSIIWYLNCKIKSIRYPLRKLCNKFITTHAVLYRLWPLRPNVPQTIDAMALSLRNHPHDTEIAIKSFVSEQNTIYYAATRYIIVEQKCVDATLWSGIFWKQNVSGGFPAQLNGTLRVTFVGSN